MISKLGAEKLPISYLAVLAAAVACTVVVHGSKL